MGNRHAVRDALAIDADELDPRIHCVHDTGIISFALTPLVTDIDVYLRGTAGELREAARQITDALDRYRALRAVCGESHDAGDKRHVAMDHAGGMRDETHVSSVTGQ